MTQRPSNGADQRPEQPGPDGAAGTERAKGQAAPNASADEPGNAAAPGTSANASAAEPDGAAAAPANAAPAPETVRLDDHTTVIPDPDNPDMVTVRTRKKRRKRKKRHGFKALSRGKRIALIVVGIILALVVVAAIAAAVLINSGNANLHLGSNELTGTPSNMTQDDSGNTLEYKGHHYVYNKNIVSCLLVGHDDESEYSSRPNSNCADAIVLVALDTETKKAKAIMVPRNSYVNVDIYQNNQFVATKRMNLTLSYAIDAKPESKCAENTVKAVSRIFYGIPLKYYASLDEKALSDAADAVGGVPLKALDDIPGAPYKKGDDVLLTGEDAYRYVQYRDTSVYESALDRQKRQVQFVQAFAAKARKQGVNGIVKTYNSISDHLVTNLGASEVSYLASTFVNGKNAQLQVTQLKGKTTTSADADGVVHEHYHLNKDSVTQAMLDAFYTQVD